MVFLRARPQNPFSQGVEPMTSQDSTAEKGEPVVPVPAHEPERSTLGLGAQIRIWLVVMGLALVAGGCAWLSGEFTLDYFKPTKQASENYRDPSALNREMLGVSARNGALAFGPLGGFLGLALGLAGGISRRSVWGALLGAFAGLILGAVAGALPSFWVMPWVWAHRNDDPSTTELLIPMLVHIGLWSGAGLAAGLAFGIGSGFKPFRLFQAAFAGLIAAMIGVFVFELGAASLFPLDRTADPFSDTSRTRLLARLCVAAFVGLGAFFSIPPWRGTD
jgi:hypothetical protein